MLWLVLLFLLIVRFVYFYETRSTYINGTKIRITDRVSSEPIRYSNSQYLRLSGFKVYLPLYPEITYGDVIVVEGVVEEDKLKQTKLVELKESRGILYGLRKNLIDIYQKSLPQPHSALIAGVTIGSKQNLGEDLWEILKKSGTAHVVVASGMNISLISSFLVGFLAMYLPRRKAIPLAIIGTWVYALIAGFDAPIIRAAIMGTIAFSAQELGKLNTALRALIITALIMLFIRPDWLVDLGFLLSFFATASLLLFEKKVYKLLRFIPDGLGIVKKDFSTSIAAQIGVAPILFISFEQFNLLSPLINALVLWTIVPMTSLGIIGGIIGLVFEPVGTAILWLTFPLTLWFVKVVEVFG